MRERTIASHFVRAALRGAGRRGLDCRELLRQASLPVAIVDEPRARVAPEQFAQLIQLLWETLDDEYLGLGEQPSKRGTFAMMGHAIIHCRTLDKALQRGILFYRLFPWAAQIQLRREGEWAYLCLTANPPWDPDHFLAESLLVIWHRLSSWLIGQRIRIAETTFAYGAPAHASEYDLLFPGPRRFAAEHTGILFQASYLEMPILQDERTLKHFLKHSPADLLARPVGGHSLSSRIRRLLGRNCTDWPDLDNVARQLHCSPQTLRRRLREEGTSFQELKDHLRRDQAIYLLSRAELSIQTIAEQLGFSEPSAFHRAFKKWTDLTPGAYRALES